METIIEQINAIDFTVLSQSGWSNSEGYLNRAYRFLNNIQHGKIYSVSKLADKIELFRLIICLYILETPYCRISFIDEELNYFRKL